MVDTRSCKKAVSSLLSVRFIILPLVANLLISKQLIEVSSICLDLKQTGVSTIDDICCIFFYFAVYLFRLLIVCVLGFILTKRNVESTKIYYQRVKGPDERCVLNC